MRTRAIERPGLVVYGKSNASKQSEPWQSADQQSGDVCRPYGVVHREAGETPHPSLNTHANESGADRETFAWLTTSNVSWPDN